MTLVQVSLQDRMNAMLAKIAPGFKAKWSPKGIRNRDAIVRVEDKTLEVFAEDEHDAWDLFISILWEFSVLSAEVNYP